MVRNGSDSLSREDIAEETVLMGHGIVQRSFQEKGPRLVIYGLGSCIALIMIDEEHRVHGMSHILLPYPKRESDELSPLKHKYASTSVPTLFTSLVANGGTAASIKALVIGGSDLIDHSLISVGSDNIAAVRKELARLGIKIYKEDVGGQKGRTIIFDTSKMLVHVKLSGTREYRTIYSPRA